MEGQRKPVATAIDPATEQPLQEQDERQARKRVWRAAERIAGRNRDRNPDEVLAAVTEVVEEVRQDRYGRERTGS